MDCSGDRPARSDGGLGLGAEETLGQVRAAHGAAPATRAMEVKGGEVVDREGGWRLARGRCCSFGDGQLAHE